MEKKRKNMLWRIPLVVMIIITIFWGIWYLATGSIPVVNEVKLTNDSVILLPLSVSRLCTIPTVFVFVFGLALLFTSKSVKRDGGLEITIYTMVLGITFGLTSIAGLFSYLLAVVALSLLFGILIGGAFKRSRDRLEMIFPTSLICGSGLAAGFSLTASVVLGLSLAVFIATSIISLIIVPVIAWLVIGVKFLLSKKFANWLAGN